MEPFDISPLTTPLIESHFKAVTVPPPLTQKPLAVQFIEICRRQPQKAAFIYRQPDVQRTSLTFGQLLATAGTVAEALLDAGVQARDSVALFGPNSPEYNVAEYGIALAGAAVVRLHSFLKSTEDLRHVVQKAGCKGLLFYPGLDKEYLDIIKNLTAGPEVGMEFCYCLADGCEGFKFLDAIRLSPSSDCKLGSLPDVIEERIHEIKPEDTVTVFLTSGSTGFPKLVPYNSINALMKIPGQMARWGLNAEDVLINDRPCSYVGSLGYWTVVPGMTRVILDPRTALHGGDTDYLFRMIEEERPTCTLLFPYLVYRYLEFARSRRYDLSSLNVILTGGQLVAKNLLLDVLQFVPIVNICGATECSGTTTLSTRPSDPLEDRLNFTGYPMPYLELKIVDDAGETTPIGVAGELYIKSPLLFAGYVSDEAKTRSVMLEGGWFKTDDMADMDARGYINILGRRTEVITRAAIKIYPATIEKILLQNEKVDKVVVLGLPNKELGQEVCACVVPKGGSCLTAKEMLEFCHENLSEKESGDGRGLNPEHVLIWKEFPLNANQKLDRKQAIALAAAELHIQQR